MVWYSYHSFKMENSTHFYLLKARLVQDSHHLSKMIEEKSPNTRQNGQVFRSWSENWTRHSLISGLILFSNPGRFIPDKSGFQILLSGQVTALLTKNECPQTGKSAESSVQARSDHLRNQVQVQISALR